MFCPWHLQNTKSLKTSGGLLIQFLNPRFSCPGFFYGIISKVAGVRHCTQGKIQLPVLPAEITTSNCELSSFSYRNKSSRPIRILESPLSDLLDPEIRTFLSGISLITEILLD